jgi:hypothetical protein
MNVDNVQVVLVPLTLVQVHVRPSDCKAVLEQTSIQKNIRELDQIRTQITDLLIGAHIRSVA